MGLLRAVLAVHPEAPAASEEAPALLSAVGESFSVLVDSLSRRLKEKGEQVLLKREEVFQSIFNAVEVRSTGRNALITIYFFH